MYLPFFDPGRCRSQENISVMAPMKTYKRAHSRYFALHSRRPTSTMKPLSTPFTTFTDRMRGRGNKALYIEYAITICCGLGYVCKGSGGISHF